MRKTRMPSYWQASSNLPNAWIVTNNRKNNLSNDRGRKKIYTNNKVYLENGQEFELELMNPLSNSVLAMISVNGQKISNSGLVLRPGERVYLDCYLDTRKKFTFNTYQVEDSSESKKAIQNNGFVSVSFHPEVVLNYTTPYVYGSLGDQVYPHMDSTRIGGMERSSIFVGNTINSSDYTTNLSSGISSESSYCFNPDSGEITTGGSVKESFSESISKKSKKSLFTNNINKLNNNLETGRVEGGSQSNQIFDYVDMNFQNYAISSVTYQILPEKIKPVTIEDFKPKNYCPGCGKKLSGNDNFCSSCGTKLK